MEANWEFPGGNTDQSSQRRLVIVNGRVVKCNGTSVMYAQRIYDRLKMEFDREPTEQEMILAIVAGTTR